MFGKWKIICNFAEESTPNKYEQMRTSIKTIFFLALLSVVLLFATYSISLNDENRWIVLDSPWLSNRFAFAIAGGSFASLLVVLACELLKYQSLKRQTEDFIFSQLFSLYSQIIIIHYKTKRAMNANYDVIPPNLIEDCAKLGLSVMNSINTIDYSVLFKHKKNAFTEIVKRINNNDGKLIRTFLEDTIFLKIAINEDKINLLKQHKSDKITAESPLTHAALEKNHADTLSILAFLEDTLSNIDNKYNNRYNWTLMHRNIILYQEQFVETNLDTYLQQDVIKFG